MSDTAAATGTRTLGVEFEGEQLTLAPITFGIEGRYTAWLEQQRMQTTYRLGAVAPADAYAVMLNGTVEAISRGDYEWGGDVCRKSLNTDKGRSQLVYYCLKKSHPDITPERAAEVYRGKRAEVNAVLAALNPSVFVLQAPLGDDPGGAVPKAPPAGSTGESTSAPSPTAG